MKFEEIQNALGKYLIINKETDYLLDIMIAVALSVECKDPIWIMIQAPSSSGKSKHLKLLDELPGFHKLFSLSPKTLFSGHTEAGGGFIPSRMGNSGILCIPDFTTVLSARIYDRKEIFSQLRMAFDGEAGRASGVDVKNINTWHGKIALIAGVTDVIEIVKSKMSLLGERFLYYRYDTSNLNLDNFHYKMGTNNNSQKIEIQDHINQFVKEKIKTVVKTAISPEVETWIKDASKYIAQARAAVQRDSFTKEITSKADPEGNYRLIEQLSTFHVCLITVNGNKSRTHNIMKEIIISSVPGFRMKLINLISVANMTTAKLSDELGFTQNIIRRELEDMVAQKIIIKISDEKAHRWCLSPEFKKLHLNVFNKSYPN